MHRRVVFRGIWLPCALLLPQLAITVVFFLWPAGQALSQSFFLEDAFGFGREFVGLENYAALFEDQLYIRSFVTSAIFGLSVAGLALGIALALAVAANRLLRNAAYTTALIWPYAVAPALAGAIWYFLMNPSIGIVAHWLGLFGYRWDHYTDGAQALTMLIAAAVWKQVSYNFIFFLAGLAAIPAQLIEAAALDGAGPVRRFWTITFPLLAPTTFFLLVVNLVYGFFDNFALIHATTNGGPANATATLVYRVYDTGFIGQDYGSSAAQSVILMALIALLTVFQFRFIERRVTYQ